LNLTDLKEHQRLSALIDGPVKALKTTAKPPTRKLKPVVEDTDAVPTRFRRADDK
jgi:hypothetical protein